MKSPLRTLTDFSPFLSAIAPWQRYLTEIRLAPDDWESVLNIAAAFFAGLSVLGFVLLFREFRPLVQKIGLVASFAFVFIFFLKCLEMRWSTGTTTHPSGDQRISLWVWWWAYYILLFVSLASFLVLASLLLKRKIVALPK